MREQTEMMLDTGWGDQRLQRDIEALQEQVRELQEKQAETAQTLSEQIKDSNQFVFQNVAPMINQIDNGDFVFTQLQIVPGSTYVGVADDLGNWYRKALFVSGSTAFVEHTPTVRSADAIFGLNPLDNVIWDRAQGILSFRGGIIGTPLPKNLAFPGTSIYVRLQTKRNSGFTFPPTWRLLAAIFDNTAGILDFVTATPYDLSATPAFAAPGAFSRQYILRVDTPNTFFYSDVVSPVTVNNQVSVLTPDNTNFVNVSWQVFPQAVRYRLYRFDSQTTNWRLIADIANGATSFRDVGGVTGDLFVPTGVNSNQQAHASFVNFGDYVNSSSEYQDVVFNILVPSTYNYAATTGKQWLVLYIVDENLVGQSLSFPDMLLFDKVSLGYTNGRFTYSAKDLTIGGVIQATTPPPVPPPGGNEGDGGGSPPPTGGGGSGRPIGSCVKPDTKILVAKNVHPLVDPSGRAWGCAEWREAKDVEVGDYLINIASGASKVAKIIKGTAERLYTITTEKNKQVVCSPTHRLMEFEGSDEGKLASDIRVGDSLWVMNAVWRGAEKVTSIEITETPELSDVMTFQLEEGHRTYVSNGIVSHNMKPIE